MRVLWITNIPVAGHRSILGLPLNQSGGWIETAYASLKGVDNLTLGVATTYDGNTIIKGEENRHFFYLLPCHGDRSKDISNNPDNQCYWKTIIDEFKPDVIHLWGTEFSHGLCALKVAEGIPSVAYIQGMMSQIAYHFLAEISWWDQIKNTTLRDIVLRQCFWDLSRKQEIRAGIEETILKKVNGVIVENRWCANNCKLINKDLRVFKSLLPINPVFSEFKWSVENMRPHSLFTVAGNYPHKGFHILLKTLSLLKDHYPDVKLYVPGSVNRGIRRSSYYKYTSSIIKKYGLEENIEYVGQLSPQEMAEHMARCNAFVMPSSIENHSSTLIEAMMVGAPCVASYVGGVSDYLDDSVNGFFYRFDEYQTAAAILLNIFRDNNLASAISESARTATCKDRLSINLEADFISCYNMIKRI